MRASTIGQTSTRVPLKVGAPAWSSGSPAISLRRGSVQLPSLPVAVAFFAAAVFFPARLGQPDWRRTHGDLKNRLSSCRELDSLTGGSRCHGRDSRRRDSGQRNGDMYVDSARVAALPFITIPSETSAPPK